MSKRLFWGFDFRTFENFKTPFLPHFYILLSFKNFENLKFLYLKKDFLELLHFCTF